LKEFKKYFHSSNQEGGENLGDPETMEILKSEEATDLIREVMGAL
jgi:hypothetical protein